MKESRIYGLDVLRGSAMILGIVLHGAIAYKEGYHHGQWVFDSYSRSFFFDWVFLFINSFRMQVFFLLSGFFAHLLISKRGEVPFLKNRMARIGGPLALGYFTILPLTLIPYLYVDMGAGADIWMKLKEFFIGFFTLRRTSGLMHLWFLQHLLVYCTGATIMVYLGRRFNLTGKIHMISQRLSTAFVIGFSALSVFGITMLYDAVLPFIWTGFVIPLPQLLYYALFFGLGWLLFTRQDLLPLLSKSGLILVLGGLVLSLVVVFMLNSADHTLFSNQFIIALRGLFSVLTLVMVAGLIGVAVRFFNKPSEIWKYISESAYWVYLIHMPLVMGFQLVLQKLPMSSFLKFPIVVFLTTAIAFITYHTLVRYTWVGRLLNGKTPHAKEATHEALKQTSVKTG